MAAEKRIFLEDLHMPECKHIYVATEKRCTYRLNNPENLMVLQTRVDGELYDSNDGKKCDYAFSSKEFSTAILVELKGGDIKQAVRQLQSTFEAFKDKYRYKRYYGRIVASRINAPDVQSPEYRHLSGLLKSTGGNLAKKTKSLEEKLEKDFSCIS